MLGERFTSGSGGPLMAQLLSAAVLIISDSVHDGIRGEWIGPSSLSNTESTGSRKTFASFASEPSTKTVECTRRAPCE